MSGPHHTIEHHDENMINTIINNDVTYTPSRFHYDAQSYSETHSFELKLSDISMDEQDETHSS